MLALMVLVLVLLGVGLYVNVYLYIHHAFRSAATTSGIKLDDLFARWPESEVDIW